MDEAKQLANIAEFARLARGFCDWCEGPELAAPSDVLASTWLAKLHAAALELPEVDAENDSDEPELPQAEADRARVNLAAFDGFYYREFFDPNPLLDEEPGIGDVGDDLADIYKDIRRALVLYEAGQAKDAAWHWSFLHRIHWGRHAVGAMFALHCARPSGEKSRT